MPTIHLLPLQSYILLILPPLLRNLLYSPQWSSQWSPLESIPIYILTFYTIYLHTTNTFTIQPPDLPLLLLANFQVSIAALHLGMEGGVLVTNLACYAYATGRFGVGREVIGYQYVRR